MSEIIRKEAFTVMEGRPVTSSLIVAEYFDKRHNDVLRTIRAIIAKKAELSEDFIEIEEQVATGKGATRTTPVIMMDKKGFSILAMGFTGSKALDFKVAFYDEFERMAVELDSLRAQALYARAADRVAAADANPHHHGIPAGEVMGDEAFARLVELDTETVPDEELFA